MRLLIITQKIDEQDAVLGFMRGWIAEFARQAGGVIVVCLEKGRVNLPENITVVSLGKEKHNFQFPISNVKIVKKLKYAWRFVRYIVQFRNEYDAVFVHMNPEYIVLGGFLWRLWGKTVTLWYAHKRVPWYLRLALAFTDIVFTSTASGFRLPSQKVKIIGQGIDTEKFKVESEKFKVKERENVFKIATVGRVTPSKDYDTLIEAVDKIHKGLDKPVSVDIIGPASGESDELYLRGLKEKIAQKDLAGIIAFLGPVSNIELPDILSGYDLFVNMGQTGSLDKAVPEAMAVGLPILTCNEAFKEVLGPFTGDLMYPKGDFGALADKIKKTALLSEIERTGLGKSLRAIVVRDHGLQSFVGKIIFAIESFIKDEPVQN